MKKTGKMITRFATYMAAMILFAACSMTVFADAEGTVIPGSAKVRSSADTSSNAVASVKANDKLTITGKTTGADGQTWYQIVDGNTKGYIRADLVKVNGTVEGSAGSDATVTETNADVQPSDASSGTITSASVNVRKGPATTDAVVVSAKQGTVVTILGQTTGADGKTWYQVSFVSNGSDVTGFIREDLLEVSAAVEGTDGGEGSEAPETEAPDSGEGAGEGSTGSGYTEVSNVVSSRILPEDADLSKMEIDESKLAEWESGNYYLLYTTDTNGGKYWYLYDLSNQECTKINNLAGGEPAGTSGGEGFGTTAKIVIAILAVLVVILIVAVTLLMLKLRDSQWDEGYDEEEDGYYGDEDGEPEAYEEGRVDSRRWKPRNFLRSNEEEYEDEEFEEEEIEEEPERPVRRRPAPGSAQAGARQQAVEGRPARGQAPAAPRQTEQRAARPQGSGQTARRPAGQAPEQRAARPQGSGQTGQRPAGQAPEQRAARPQGSGQAGQRPAGQTPEQRAARPQGSGQAQRRPAGQAAEQRAARPQGNPQHERPAQVRKPQPKPQPAYYEEEEDDDEFEFEFLNMDGRDDM
ncbi:MAG: SH3 domain-containing protein [Lachnospiraceae bacterium]|nr:SH3 domain-containing protein [Lachnospiraceae bacterium]